MAEKRTNLKILSIDELNILAQNVRKTILEVIPVNGGHLASNLGVVELTIALHYVFDFPKDKLLFDVGHQCYTHKILTRDNFSSIRKKDGLSGFPKSSESKYDYFNTGHSSTALSIACGLMRARKLKNENYEIVSLVGDGSLSNGMCFEALNDSASIDAKQIIVLNDNNMTISATVGGVTKILKCENSAKCFFNSLGFDYIGQINGHDFVSLIDALECAKQSKKSVVVHVITEKGKGYNKAEECPDKFHSVGAKCGDSFSKRMGDTLVEMAGADKRVVAVTAAMADGTGLGSFANKYPDRFFDTGIAEGHAVTMCAALAKEGLKPYFAVYSTFLQRGFDQIIHDIMVQNLSVTLCVDHSGIVSDDGETHQGLINLSFLRTANMIIASPKNGDELEAMLKWTLTVNKPIALRYCKGGEDNFLKVSPISLGKWEYFVENGEQGIIIYTGSKMANLAVKLKESAMNNGLNLSTVNARFVNPIDEEMLDVLKDKKIFIFEDNILAGGLSSSIFEYYNKKGYCANNIMSFTFDNVLIPNMTSDEAYDEFGFNFNNILSKALNFFAK
ncbi:MAG: 1-deoxy-D-xylulose-5-phosphate synthase [Clostridia bacterium]